MRASRTPEIMADAAYVIFNKPAREFSGHFLIDDKFLAENGVTDFEKYRADPTQKLASGLFRARQHCAAAGREDRSGVSVRPHASQRLRRL